LLRSALWACRASALAALGGTEIELDAVPRVGGVDAGEMDNSIITLVRPQLDIWRAAGKPQRLLIRYRRQPDAGFPRPADTAPATAARITAILRTLEIERGVRFDHADWANHQGIALHAL
jgi:Zn-finger nucleic acid-binding protein